MADLAKIANLTANVTTLPVGARVVAIVVGLEDYQSRASGGLSKVEYARRDAEGFAEALRAVYASDQLNLTLLVDNAATVSNIGYDLLQAIQSLGEDDLFIFYYAGHGFYGAGGNRITCWDSHAHNLEGTTLLLRDVLIDRLDKSACHRALAFIDACASDMSSLIGSRDVVSSLKQAELNEFLKSAHYRALFLSCSPGQKSYPSAELKNGVWTHFLLKAIRGEAEEALGPGRYLTDAGLRDYLRREVSKYIAQQSEYRSQQIPEAMITASNTFAIREVPALSVPTAAVGNLQRLSNDDVGTTVDPEQERARSMLAPELARVMAQQVFVLDRITVNYSCSSPYSKSSIKPNDTWPSIKPKQPTLYPHASSVAELSVEDGQLLVEFYDSLQEVADLIMQYEKIQIDRLPYNEWNYLMHAAEHNLEVGLRAARRFCPNREYRPHSPASGTLVSQVERVLKAAAQARDVFFKSAEAHKQEEERKRHMVTPPGAPHPRRTVSTLPSHGSASLTFTGKRYDDGGVVFSAAHGGRHVASFRISDATLQDFGEDFKSGHINHGPEALAAFDRHARRIYEVAERLYRSGRGSNGGVILLMPEDAHPG